MHHFPDGTNLFHTSKTVKNLNKLVNRDWLSANKVILIAEKTELVHFKSPRKVLPDELKISYSGKSLYPSNSLKFLCVGIDRFLHCHKQVIALQLNLKELMHYCLKSEIMSILKHYEMSSFQYLTLTLATHVLFGIKAMI